MSDTTSIPINYQYPLSSAIYRIIAKGNAEYACFLHETGYGKGFKLFTFCQMSVPLRIENDRLVLKDSEVFIQVAFHVPQALESFVKGLFQSEQIEIADKRSKARFTTKSVESLPNPLQQYGDNEIINIELEPLSSIVAGLHNEKGNYDFLSPEDPRFRECLIHNWRSKIGACYDEETADTALLMMEPIPFKKPFKSRLITIKAGTSEETKVRGWMNFGLKVTGERRFVEVLINAGAGTYNAMGMGFVGIDMVMINRVSEKMQTEVLS